MFLAMHVLEIPAGGRGFPLVSIMMSCEAKNCLNRKKNEKKKRKKKRKKPTVPNLKFAEVFGFLGCNPPTLSFPQECFRIIPFGVHVFQLSRKIPLKS